MGGNAPAENTGKWIAATFEHDTARPVDGYPAPHLHTHVVVFNMTEDARGQARSLQPYELFKIQSMATAVYQNQLEYELRQAGYKIERGLNHAPEIKGYSREYLEAESLRNAEIQTRAEGARAVRCRGHQQHQAPESGSQVEPHSRRTQGDAQAAMQPSSATSPAACVAEAAERHTRTALTPEKIQEKAQAAVTFARERLGERSAVFEHFEVIRDALRHVQGKVRLPEIQAELDRQLGEGRFQKVDHVRPHAPAARYTTPELVQTERDAIERVRAGIGQAEPIANAHFARNRSSTVQHVERRSAAAGPGRADDPGSDLRDPGRSRNGQNDRPPRHQRSRGRARIPSHRARPDVARRQRSERGRHGGGNPARHSCSRGAQAVRTMPGRASSSSMNRAWLPASRCGTFSSGCSAQDRVLLIGDTRQHQSVEAGRIFDELQRAGMNTATLSKIVRQKDEGLRTAVEAMASGQVERGVELLSEQNRVQ